MDFPRSKPETERFLLEMKNDPARAIFVFGIVCYLDIYDVDHRTEYCAAFDGLNFATKTPCTYGEKAD